MVADLHIAALRALSKQWEGMSEFQSGLMGTALSGVAAWVPGFGDMVNQATSGNLAYLRSKHITSSTIAGVSGVTGQDMGTVSEPFREEGMISAWAHSPYAEFTMRYIGAAYVGSGPKDGLYNQYNHKLLVSTGPGKDAGLEEMDWRTLRAMFKEPYGAGHNWPHLVLTGNHAYADKVSDMTGLMHGAEALIQHAFPPERVQHKPTMLYGADATPKKNDIMVVGACDTKRNSFFNGADLIERLSYRKAEVEQSKADPEYAVRHVEYASPAARRLAKTILVLLAENPEALDPDEPFVLPSDKADRNPDGVVRAACRDSKINPDAEIVLRPDAVEVARHLKLFGYSLGANTVSDAMRLVVRELTAMRPGQNVGRFAMSSGPEGEAPRALVGGEVGDSKHWVADIVKRVGILTVAPGETPLSEAHKDWGMRRINLLNKNDSIASHFWHDSRQWNNTYMPRDNLLKFEGDFASLGHAPESALGNQETRGKLYGNGVDGPIVDRLQSFWAPLLGKAAISDVRFTNLDGAHAVVLEPSVGTSPDDLKAKSEQIAQAINGALEKADASLKERYGSFSVTYDYELGEFELVSGNKVDLADDVSFPGLLKEGMQALKDDTKNGLFISQAVFSDIKDRQNDLSGKSGDIKRA